MVSRHRAARDTQHAIPTCESAGISGGILQVVAITGPRQCALVERPDPKITGEFARVRFTSRPCAPSSRGTRMGASQTRIGHEAAGEVARWGAQGRGKVGDRVVVMPQYPCGKCNLCLAGDYIHCEHTIDPLRSAGARRAPPPMRSTASSKIGCCFRSPLTSRPTTARWPAAVWDPPSARCNAWRWSFRYGAGRRAGSGGAGRGDQRRFRGARVIGLDPNPYRAQLAQTLGAEAMVNPADPDAVKQIKALTDGRGADTVIDCTAVSAAQKLAIEATHVAGTSRSSAGAATSRWTTWCPAA